MGMFDSTDNSQLASTLGGLSSAQAAPSPLGQSTTVTAPPPDQAPVTDSGVPPAMIQDVPTPDVPEKDLPRFHRTMKNTLLGMAMGLAQGGLPGAVAGAASPEWAQRNANMAAQSQDTKLQQQQANVQFTHSQAASLAADAALKQQQINSFGQKFQAQMDSMATDQMKAFEGMGIRPTIVAANTPEAVTAAMQKLTTEQGGVPPMYTVHMGDKIVGYDLTQLTQTPQGLQLVNNRNKVLGMPTYSDQQWSLLPATQRITLTNASMGYWHPIPSNDALVQYKNDLLTAQAQPQTPEQKDAVTKLKGIVDKMQSVLDDQHAHLESQKVSDKKAEGKVEVGIAGAKSYAEEAGKNKADMEAMGKNQTIFGDPVTPPAGGVKEYNKVRDAFKKQADNLGQTEQTYDQFRSIINTPDDKLTGAQSVVGLFDALGISAEPLKGKGFRMSNDVINEHINARGLPESLTAKLLKLKSGDVVTPQQLKDYANIAMQARHDAYITNYNEAKNYGVNPDFLLPSGNGRKIDPSTAKIFIDLAGGSPDKARTAAAAKGWKF